MFMEIQKYERTFTVRLQQADKTAAESRRLFLHSFEKTEPGGGGGVLRGKVAPHFKIQLIKATSIILI
jgi:hypothetical protein